MPTTEPVGFAEPLTPEEPKTHISDAMDIQNASQKTSNPATSWCDEDGDDDVDGGDLACSGSYSWWLLHR